MSDKGKNLSRRSVAVGGSIAVALGLGALGITARRWHAKTPYDDLLDKLIDRDAAATVGQAVLGTATLDSKEIASDLRKRLSGRALADVAKEDLAANRLIEAKGWVLPESVGLLCALAARSA